MNRFITAMLLAVGLSIPAAAAEYVVQIGAFRHPNPSFAEAASTVGQVSNRVTASGLTRVEVGSYASRTAAIEALERLRAAGYDDAFVRRSGAGNPAPAALAPRTPAVSAAPKPRGVQDELASLPADIRRRAVILDGRLHIKEGNRFIPIAEYGR